MVLRCILITLVIRKSLMSPSSRFLFASFILIAMACSKTPSSCDRCDREVTTTRCYDNHRQFEQGVIFNLDSEAVEFIPLPQMDIFMEVFLMEVDLIAVSERVVLVSSEHGNYLVDVFGAVVVPLDDAEAPVVAKYGDRRFFGIQEKTGEFSINDEFALSNVQLSAQVLELPISGGEPAEIMSVETYVSGEDSLITGRIFFPHLSTDNTIDFLKIEEVRSFYTNETTGQVRTNDEYMRRRWERLNLTSKESIALSNWETVTQLRKPERYSISDDQSLRAYQPVRNKVLVSETDNEANTILQLDEARSPQISPNGAFISYSDFNLVEVLDRLSGKVYTITDESDYTYYNPTGFLRDGSGVLLSERRTASSDLRDMGIRKIEFDENGITSNSTKFRLIEHLKVDSLDFLVSRASQPVDLGNNNVFFLLFQHQLSLCDN